MAKTALGVFKGFDLPFAAPYCYRMVEGEETGPAAAGELLPLVYDELKRLAAHRMAQESPGQTLQATALVHEAYLRLTHTGEDPRWKNKAHFFGAAAEAMRRILIDRARKRNRFKRGGEMKRTIFDQSQIEAPAGDAELLAIDEALGRFAKVDSAGAELVKLRYFVGLTLQEIAEATGVSLRTVKRQWTYARVWLKKELRDFEAP
jgi:RNA polymerase sigma factor (TIGR02999 family)